MQRRFKLLSLSILFGLLTNGGLASAGCMLCPDGHVTCHDPGGIPDCSPQAPRPIFSTSNHLGASNAQEAQTNPGDEECAPPHRWLFVYSSSAIVQR